MNLVEYLQKATSYLDKHEVPSPRLNAELLLSNLLGVSRLEIYTGFERQLTDAEANAYRDLLARRAAGWPIQYLTGEAGFRELILEVRPGVFIPRPETEVLVDKAIEVIPGGEVDVLDLGCGCGNIAVTIALELPGARLTAIDCETAAVELSRRNAARYGVPDMVRVLEGDLFEPLRGSPTKFDVIVSNPPYVPEGCLDSIPKEVRDYEPRRALFAGADGMDVIKRITGEAARYLKSGGWLVLEVDESHAHNVTDLLLSPSPVHEKGPTAEQAAKWDDVSVFQDLAGRPRVVRAKLG